MAELFILTDFQKFKDEMLANKKAMGEGVVKEEEQTRINVKVGDDTLFYKFAAENADDVASGWNKRLTFKARDDNISCNIWCKTVEGFRLDWARVEVTYHDITFD